MSGSNKQSGEQSNITSNEPADTADSQAPITQPQADDAHEPEVKLDKEPKATTDKPANAVQEDHARVSQAKQANTAPLAKPSHTNEAAKQEPQQQEHKELHPNKESKMTQENCASDKKCKKGGTGLSLLAIAMVAGLGGFIFAYAHPKVALQLEQITTLQNEIDTLRTELSAQAQKNSALLTKQQEEAKFSLQQNDNSISALQKTLLELKGRRPNDWLLAEADFLVKRAGRQIWLEQDMVTAIRLLETADQRISELNDPSLTPIRQAIASDIQELKSVVRVDADGIVLKLTSLQMRVDKLPLSHV
ncbi:MAG: uroporphyrinogen-III C-methyltransferase, partial [Vibrionaceae bacterium]